VGGGGGGVGDSLRVFQIVEMVEALVHQRSLRQERKHKAK
jgi:hypothetical protein